MYNVYRLKQKVQHARLNTEASQSQNPKKFHIQTERNKRSSVSESSIINNHNYCNFPLHCISNQSDILLLKLLSTSCRFCYASLFFRRRRLLSGGCAFGFHRLSEKNICDHHDRSKQSQGRMTNL